MQKLWITTKVYNNQVYIQLRNSGFRNSGRSSLASVGLSSNASLVQLLYWTRRGSCPAPGFLPANPTHNTPACCDATCMLLSVYFDSNLSEAETTHGLC